MIRLLKFLKSKWYFAVLAPLFMLLEVTMDLFQPTLMADIINIGVANGDVSYIFSTGLRMLGVALLGVVGGVGCTVFSSITAAYYGMDLRNAIFKKIQTLSFAEIDKLKTSSLITRVTNDVMQMQHIVLMGLRAMVRSPLLFIGGIVMAIRLSLKLSVVFFVIVPVICLVIFIILSRATPFFRLVQQRIDRVNTVMRENLLGIRVIKAFVGSKTEEKRFKSANDDLMNTNITAQNITMLLMPIVNVIMQFGVVAVLWFGGLMFGSGEILTGDIMAFINYLLQIMFSLMMTVMLFLNFSRAKASADRINEVLDTTVSVTESENATDISGFDVEFKNVSFRYHNSGEWVLNDISFKANQGETIGIIGATGSGKSTLVSLIPRLYDVKKGEILIGGKNLKQLKIKNLRDKIGIVLQESILFSGSIRDNLMFGNKNASDELIEKCVKTAQAYDFIESLPKKYESSVEQRGKNLSGGQKQRVSIARTLIREPKILIMDDSSSALDMATEARLQTALRENMSDCTTFIIAQRISGVMYCDRIIVLDGGKISGFASHSELMETNEIYRSIAVSQLGEEASHNVNA